MSGRKHLAVSVVVAAGAVCSAGASAQGYLGVGAGVTRANIECVADCDNTGSGFISFEFMQDPPPAACGDYSGSQADLIANCNPWANRQAGDFMILWDQQGGSKDLFLRTWSGTGDNLTLSAAAPLNSTVSQAAYSADGFLGEAAVNLTDTVFGGSTACRVFANTIPSTVTGAAKPAP